MLLLDAWPVFLVRVVSLLLPGAPLLLERLLCLARWRSIRWRCWCEGAGNWHWAGHQTGTDIGHDLALPQSF